MTAMNAASDIMVDRTKAQPALLGQGGLIAFRLGRLLNDANTRQGLVSVIDQGVVSGTSFITGVIIGRLCTKEEMGVYSLALSLVLLVRGIQNEVISTPYMIYSNRKKGARLAAYAGSTLLQQTALAAIGCILLMTLAGLLTSGIGPAPLAPVVWVLLVAGPLMLWRESVRYFAFSHLKHGTAALLDAAVAVLQIGGLLILAHVGRLTVGAVFMTMGLAAAAACVGWFVLGRQPVRLVRSKLAEDWRLNWSYGRWALASQLIGCTTPCLIPWIVAAARGEAETGVFAACWTLVGLSNMFIVGVANYLTPQAARAYASHGRSVLAAILRKTAGLFAVTLGLLCLASFLAGDAIAAAVFGGKYAGAGWIMTALALGALANGIGVVTGNGLCVIDRPRANVPADVCLLFASLLTAFLLVPPLGALGAAIAIFLGTTLGTVVRTITLRQLMNSLDSPTPSA